MLPGYGESAPPLTAARKIFPLPESRFWGRDPLAASPIDQNSAAGFEPGWKRTRQPLCTPLNAMPVMTGVCAVMPRFAGWVRSSVSRMMRLSADVVVQTYAKWLVAKSGSSASPIRPPSPCTIVPLTAPSSFFVPAANDDSVPAFSV